MFRQVSSPIEDIWKRIREVSDRVTEILSLKDRVERQLTAAGLSLEVDLRNLKNSPKLDKLAPESIRIPGMAALKKNYRVLKELFDSLTEIESMEARIRVSMGPDSGINSEKALSEISRLKDQVKTGIHTSLDFLSDLSNKHHPKSLEEFASIVQNILSADLQYEKISLRSFIFTAEDESLCFSDYLRITGVTGEDGKYTPQLFVVLTYKTGQKPEVYLAVTTAFMPPSDDLLAKRVSSIQETMRAIAFLLDLEKISNEIGTLPVSLVMNPNALNKSLFSYQQHVSKILVEKDSVSFLLKPSIKEKKDVDNISTKIFNELQVVIKKSKARMRMQIFKIRSTFRITFRFVTATGLPLVDSSDLQFLADRFNLDSESIGKIVRVMNVGK